MGLGQQLCAMEVMYALLVNQTNPPANALSANIQPAPPVSVTATASPQPSNTARPLHDGDGPGREKQARSKMPVILGTILTLLQLY